VNVKHVKGLFKAEGINNTAEPGNSMHIKFYVSISRQQWYCELTTDIELLTLDICTLHQGWGQLHMNVINYNYMKICQLQL